MMEKEKVSETLDFDFKLMQLVIWENSVTLDSMKTSGLTYVMCLFSRLLGVITKKDVLRHVKQMDNEDPNSVLFNWELPQLERWRHLFIDLNSQVFGTDASQV